VVDSIYELVNSISPRDVAGNWECERLFQTHHLLPWSVQANNGELCYKIDILSMLGRASEIVRIACGPSRYFFCETNQEQR
jgi:hypothetical protein